MTPPVDFKRARITPPEHDVATAPESAHSLISRVPVAVLEQCFAFSSLETIGRCRGVNKHFRKIHTASPMQRIFCRLLGIIPSDSASHNTQKIFDAEAFIKDPIWAYPTDGYGSYDGSEYSIAYSPLVSLRGGSEVVVSPVRTLIRSAAAFQKALSQSSIFNKDLQILILRSPPQHSLLPFFLLTYFRRGHAQALAFFEMSNLAFRLVFNRSDEATCTLLADRFRHLPPIRRNPGLLENLFTDSLFPGSDTPHSGKVTEKTFKIFYDLGARCSWTNTLAYFIRMTNGRSDDYFLRLFNRLRTDDDLITETVIERMLAAAPFFLGFDDTMLREWLTKFNKRGKEQLPASFLTTTMRWKSREVHDEVTHRKALNARLALLLEFHCAVDIEAFLECFRVSADGLPLITQENQDRLVELFNASKPNRQVVDAFHMSLGHLNRLGWCSEKPALLLVKDWLKKNGMPPNPKTLMRSLSGCSSIFNPRNSGTLDRNDLDGLQRILEFHSLGTDPGIIPTPRMMRAIYFIQMRTNTLYGKPANDMSSLIKISGWFKTKISDWFKEHGLAIDLSVEADFEKHLAQFIDELPPHKQMNAITFILDLLKGRRGTKSIEALFSKFPKRDLHSGYRKWLVKNNLISYPDRPAPIEPPTLSRYHTAPMPYPAGVYVPAPMPYLPAPPAAGYLPARTVGYLPAPPAAGPAPWPPAMPSPYRPPPRV